MPTTWLLLGHEKPALPPKLRRSLLYICAGLTVYILLAISLYVSLYIDEYIDEYLGGWVRWLMPLVEVLFGSGFVLSFVLTLLLSGTVLIILSIYNLNHLHKAACWFPIIVLLICIFTATYFLWVKNVFIYSMWDPTPAPFLHPRSYLRGLHDLIDQQYPVAPGRIKIEGELFRLRMLVYVAICVPLFIAMLPIWRLILLIQPYDARFCTECGYDLKGTKEARRYECPECGRSL